MSDPTALTLPQQLRHWARERGSRVALHQKDYGIWEPVTWARYEAAALRAALRDAGYTQFTVQLIPGQERAIEDWARIKRAFD